MKDAATMKEELRKLIEVAAGCVPADMVRFRKVILHFPAIRLQESEIMKEKK